MAYNGSRNGSKVLKDENFDRHLKIDDKLDSHLKPIKIGGDSTSICISDKDVKIEKDLIVGADLTTGSDAIISGDITFGGRSGSTSELSSRGDMKIDSGGNIDLYIKDSDDYVRLLNSIEGVIFQFQVDDKEFRMLGSAADIGKIDIDNTGVIRIWNVTDGSTAHIKISAVDAIYLNTGSGKIYLNGGGESSGDTFADGTLFGSFDFATGSTCKLQSASNYHLHLISNGTGDIVLDSGGDIVLDSADGNFIAKKAGTEFSAANSAYAGMILGYTDIGLNETRTDLSLTTSYVVPTDEHSVAFTAPPSGNVEIHMQVAFNAGSSGAGDLNAGLSSANATSGYSALQDYHEEKLVDQSGRNGYDTVVNSWTLTGLTAGTSYEYWVGFKSTSTTGTPTLAWGGNASGHYSDFIMKAIALPATITT